MIHNLAELLALSTHIKQTITNLNFRQLSIVNTANTCIMTYRAIVCRLLLY